MAGSVDPPLPRPAQDLTARARIRDAALAELGEKGVEKATFRSIADRAGVSVGLVQHHFGTKEQLREACDEAVMALVRHKVEATTDGSIASKPVVDGLLSSAPLIQRYVARALADGSPAIRRLLDQVMDESEDYIVREWPDRFSPSTSTTRDVAAVMTAMSLSVMVLQQHLATRIGVEPYSRDSIIRTGSAMLDVYEAFGEYSQRDDWKALRGALDAAAGRQPITEASTASGPADPADTGTEPTERTEEA